MTENNLLTLTAGKPFGQSIRVPGVKNVWNDVDDLEIRAQLRAGKTTADTLVFNLQDYMTPEFENNDLIISWLMTGEDTRLLYAAQVPRKKNYFNLIISDIGITDERALVVPLIQVVVHDTTTTAGGET